MSITVSTIGGDNRILVGANYCGRAATCLLNHNWTRVRIAMRLCVSDTGADAGGTDAAHESAFRVGLSAGSSLYGQGGSNPAHGLHFLLTGNYHHWTYNAGANPNPNYYERAYCTGQDWVSGTLVNGTPADIEEGTNYLGASDTNRTLIFCDFTRATPGATTWSMNYFRNTNLLCADVSKAIFEAQSIVLSPTVADHGWACATPANELITVDEAANGYFTHVNISWWPWVSPATYPIIKISDLRVIVLTTL